MTDSDSLEAILSWLERARELREQTGGGTVADNRMMSPVPQPAAYTPPPEADLARLQKCGSVDAFNMADASFFHGTPLPWPSPEQHHLGASLRGGFAAPTSTYDDTLLDLAALSGLTDDILDLVRARPLCPGNIALLLERIGWPTQQTTHAIVELLQTHVIAYGDDPHGCSECHRARAIQPAMHSESMAAYERGEAGQPRQEAER